MSTGTPVVVEVPGPDSPEQHVPARVGERSLKPLTLFECGVKPIAPEICSAVTEKEFKDFKKTIDAEQDHKRRREEEVASKKNPVGRPRKTGCVTLQRDNGAVEVRVEHQVAGVDVGVDDPELSEKRGSYKNWFEPHLWHEIEAAMASHKSFRHVALGYVHLFHLCFVCASLFGAANDCRISLCSLELMFVTVCSPSKSWLRLCRS